MRQSKLILLSFILLAFTSSVYTVTYEDVANVIKLAFLNRSKTAATDELKKHLKVLNLIAADNSDALLLPALKEHVSELLAPLDSNDFINRATGCLKTNQYLDPVLNLSLDKFKGDDQQKSDIYFSAVCYAAVLERLTNIVRKDYRVLEATIKYYPDNITTHPSWKETTLFGKAKFYTVKYCLEQIISAYKKGGIFGQNGLLTIPLNIEEAILRDKQLGFSDNGDAGKPFKK